jgi:hypothetical protein
MRAWSVGSLLHLECDLDHVAISCDYLVERERATVTSGPDRQARVPPIEAPPAPLARAL